MRLVDIDNLTVPKGFFENIDNIPKLFDWLESQVIEDKIIKLKGIPWRRVFEPDENGKYRMTEFVYKGDIDV